MNSHHVYVSRNMLLKKCICENVSYHREWCRSLKKYQYLFSAAYLQCQGRGKKVHRKAGLELCRRISLRTCLPNFIICTPVSSRGRVCSRHARCFVCVCVCMFKVMCIEKKKFLLQVRFIFVNSTGKKTWHAGISERQAVWCWKIVFRITQKRSGFNFFFRKNNDVIYDWI